MSRAFHLSVSFIAISCTSAPDAATGPGPAAFSGTYVLQSINGARLPYALFDLGDAYKFTVVGDRLTFANSGMVTELDSSQAVNDGTVSTATQVGIGSFIASEDTIAVTWPASGVYDYTISDSQLSAVEPTFQATWIYRRQ